MPLYYTFMRKIIVSEIKSDKISDTTTLIPFLANALVQQFAASPLGCMVYAFSNFAYNGLLACLQSFRQRIHLSYDKKALRWHNNYSTIKKNCVNLRKLTKEFYVRFDFGIIVSTCIQFSSLLAKYYTHKKKSLSPFVAACFERSHGLFFGVAIECNESNF